MNIITSLVSWGFQVLNLTITIPLSFDGENFLTFPLYLPLLVAAIGELLHVLWVAIMYSVHDVE